MKIKNGIVADLANVLFEIPLTRTESRMRTRLRELLIKQIEVIKSEHEQLLNEFIEKDSQGRIIYEDEVNNIPLFKEGLNDAYLELLNEEFIIDMTESNKKMLTTVAEVMLKSDYVYSGDLATAYDLWCEEFEKVLEFYNQED